MDDQHQYDYSLMLSKLLKVEEVGMNAHISALYDLLKNKGLSESDKNIAMCAIFLKYALTGLCIENDKQGVENKLLSEAISAAANTDDYYRASIYKDLENLIKNKEVKLPLQVFPILLLSKIACDSMIGVQTDDIDLALSSSGFQKGSTGVRDIASNADEIVKMFSQQFGLSVEGWNQHKNEELQELYQKGFIEVDDAEINNLEKFYLENNQELKPLNEVQQELAFSASERIQESGFAFLGASVSGVETSRGFSGVGSVYKTSAGLISINEEDMTISGGFTLVEPEFLNIRIGNHNGSIVVLKGKETARFKTEIYWYDSVRGREYTVEINSNLNDPSMEQEKNALLSALARTYGK